MYTVLRFGGRGVTKRSWNENLQKYSLLISLYLSFRLFLRMQELATRCTDFNEYCYRGRGSVKIRRHIRLGQNEAKLSDPWHKYRPAILYMSCANSLNMYQIPKYVFWVKTLKTKLIKFCVQYAFVHKPERFRYVSHYTRVSDCADIVTLRIHFITSVCL